MTEQPGFVREEPRRASAHSSLKHAWLRAEWLFVTGQQQNFSPLTVDLSDQDAQDENMSGWHTVTIKLSVNK